MEQVQSFARYSHGEGHGGHVDICSYVAIDGDAAGVSAADGGEPAEGEEGDACENRDSADDLDGDGHEDRDGHEDGDSADEDGDIDAADDDEDGHSDDEERDSGDEDGDIDAADDDEDGYEDGHSDDEERDSAEDDRASTRRRATRQRCRHETEWQRNARRDNRRAGRAYRTTTGRMAPARTIGDDCRCTRKCFAKVDDAHRELLFQKFYELASDNSQSAYLFGLMRARDVKRRYQTVSHHQHSSATSGVTRSDRPEHFRRSKSFQYFVRVDGKEVQICKKAFCSIHGVSRGRIEYLQGQMEEGGPCDCVVQNDMRGRHHTRPNRVSPDALEHVRGHIRSFPRYVSHYSRDDNPKQEFLPPGLSLPKLYALYQDYCAESDAEVVCESRYRKVFTEEFNLSFMHPRRDTCSKCDNLKAVVECEEDEEEHARLQAEWTEHKAAAASAFAALQDDWAAGCDNPDELLTLYFDLQKTLPTPKIATQDVYYRRQLWTYNLGIHPSCNDPVMCMWAEHQAAKSPHEIASSLLRFFTTADINSRQLTAWSDGCGGQNKNFFFVAFWWYVIEQGLFDVVEHKFPIPGHTYMPIDADFARIESKARKTQNVFLPSDWEDLVASARRQHPFHVLRMEPETLLSLQPLADRLINRKKTVDRQPVRFQKIMWFKFDRQEMHRTQFRYTMSADEPWKVVSQRRRGALQPVPHLERRFPQGKPIKPAKKADLVHLCSFLPPPWLL